MRVRPLHYDEQYTRESLNYYKVTKGEHVFDQGFKTMSSPHALSYKMRAYSKNRVPYPLKRIDWDPNGDRHPETRGTSKFERISWDEALDIIASEISRVHDTYGPFSILCQGDGHGEGKIVQGGHGCNMMLLGMADGCCQQARQPDSWEGWYWGAKHMWGGEPLGQQNNQINVFRDITQNGDAMLFWGADPETTPLGWGGQIASKMCYWFNEIGIKSIFVCPDVNYACGIHADKWIPVLPGTDAALQLAIAYVWITEGTYDQDYLETHAVGFDSFKSYVLGEIDDCAPKTPEWASEKCGVSAHTIKALARYWAKHRVSTGHGNGGGFVRSVFSHEPARLEAALLGMQGWGKPGAHQMKFIEWGMAGMASMNPVPWSESMTCLMPCYHGWMMEVDPVFVPKTLIPDAIMNPPVSWYGHSVCMYPSFDQFTPYSFPPEGQEYGIRMIWSDSPCWSTCWNGGNRFQDALRHPNMEFIVVEHPWMENDTLFADVILPVSTIFECHDIGADDMSGQVSMLCYQGQAIERLCESKTDYEIACLVAERLQAYGGPYEGLLEKYTGGKTVDEWIEFGFKESNFDCYTDCFESFKEKGFLASPIMDGIDTIPAGMYEFYRNPERNRLQTPTGKLQYYATELAQNFADDNARGPYPKWIEESEEHRERISSDRAKEYPFLLVSNHPRWRIHAQLDDVPWLREIENAKVVGPDGYAYEPVWINPADAEKLGIESGDIVALFNERGRVLGGALVTERIRPGALSQDHGARVDPIVTGFGGLDRGGANNLIAPSATSSKNAAGEVTNSFLVGIEKVDVLALAQQYPEQFNRTYDAEFGLVPDDYLA